LFSTPQPPRPKPMPPQKWGMPGESCVSCFTLENFFQPADRPGCGPLSLGIALRRPPGASPPALQRGLPAEPSASIDATGSGLCRAPRASRAADCGQPLYRDTNFSRYRARLTVPWAGRSHFCRAVLNAPPTEKTQPAPIEHLPRPRRRQHPQFQRPFELLQPQACVARALVDFRPRRAPPPEFGFDHDCPPAQPSRLAPIWPKNGARQEKAV
jgi:hypothetical protein